MTMIAQLIAGITVVFFFSGEVVLGHYGLQDKLVSYSVVNLLSDDISWSDNCATVGMSRYLCSQIDGFCFLPQIYLQCCSFLLWYLAR